MSYYMLDHSQHVKWTAGNFLKVAVVMHCTAGLDIADEVRRAGGEWAGVDNSAERTYEWSANTTTKSSWQSGSDWDSIIDGLPSGYIAWHVRGYNTYTIGHEISKTDMTWADEHEMWVGPTLLNAAIKVRQHCDKHDIPIRFIGKAQLDRAIAAKDPSMGGLTEHQLLDPDRRRDPGDDFPWERFLDLVRNPTGHDMPLTQDDIDRITEAVWSHRHKNLIHEGQTVKMDRAVAGTMRSSYYAHQHTLAARAAIERVAREVGLSDDEIKRFRNAVTEALADGVDIDVTIGNREQA